MHLNFVLPLVFFTLLSYSSAKTPDEVLLKTSIEVPIMTDGKSYGSVTLPAGTALAVGAINGEYLSLKYRGRPITVLTANTDYGDRLTTLKAADEKKQADAEAAREADEKAAKDKETARALKAYENSQRSILRIKKNINKYVGADTSAAKLLIAIHEEFARIYNATTNQEARISAHKKHTADLKALYEEKTIYGYKYNELLKDDVTVPISFNIYRDTDAFYIRVGDGSFSTIATIQVSVLGRLVQQLLKIGEWASKCIDEKMDVDKDAGTFGDIQMRFISKNGGDDVYVWLTAEGETAEGHLLQKQTVRLNMLNIHALTFHIAKAKELYELRENEKNNAKKLQ